MICPDCYGTGQERDRDLLYSCETCNGEGWVDGGWTDDDARDPYLEEERRDG